MSPQTHYNVAPPEPPLSLAFLLKTNPDTPVWDYSCSVYIESFGRPNPSVLLSTSLIERLIEPSHKTTKVTNT